MPRLGQTVGLADPVGWAVRMGCGLAMLQSPTTHSQALLSFPSGRQRDAGKSMSLGARQPQAGILALPSSPSGHPSLLGASTS